MYRPHNHVRITCMYTVYTQHTQRRFYIHIRIIYTHTHGAVARIVALSEEDLYGDRLRYVQHTKIHQNQRDNKNNK